MWTPKKWFDGFLAILFPKQCFGCHLSGVSLCNECLSRCKKAIDAPHQFIFSLYSFKDPLIKRSIHAIKYFHRRDLIEPLAEALVREYARYKDEELSKDTTLVPIPMPTMRKLLRGYNQAELLTNAIARSTSWQVDSHLLIRSKATKRQVAAKTRGERLKSQRNSFSVTRSVEGESILLVDDVATTGATLLEARKVLLDAGAKHVLAITIAH